MDPQSVANTTTQQIILLFAGGAPNGSPVCKASCDCSTENCRLMLLANPGLKSTGWNVCKIDLISPVPETTTTTTTTTAQTTTTTTTTSATTMIIPVPSTLSLFSFVLPFTFLHRRHSTLMGIGNHK